MQSIKTFPLFPLYVVIFKYEDGSYKYYAGPEKSLDLTRTDDLSMAKFYHTMGHARQAIRYHRFLGAIVGHVIVRGELYVE